VLRKKGVAMGDAEHMVLSPSDVSAGTLSRDALLRMFNVEESLRSASFFLWRSEGRSNAPGLQNASLVEVSVAFFAATDEFEVGRVELEHSGLSEEGRVGVRTLCLPRHEDEIMVGEEVLYALRELCDATQQLRLVYAGEV
jgi:hypothetical protein